jgi:hypothetical protein
MALLEHKILVVKVGQKVEVPAEKISGHHLKPDGQGGFELVIHYLDNASEPAMLEQAKELAQ